MIKVYDYKCPLCVGTVERFVDSKDADNEICYCGQTMERLVSTPRFHLDGTDPSFPGAWNKWADDKERRVKKAKAEVKEHGYESDTREF